MRLVFSGKLAHLQYYVAHCPLVPVALVTGAKAVCQGQP